MNNLSSVVLEKMPINIKNFQLRLVVNTMKHFQHRDKFDEELEPGQQVYATMNDKSPHGTVHYVVKQTGDKVSLRPKDGGSHITKLIDALWSGETANIKDTVDDISELARKRGMRNLINADREPIIAVYANEFAEYYSNILEGVLEVINTKLNTFYDKVFSVGNNDIAKPVARFLREQFERETHEAIKMSETAIEAMLAHNTDPNLVFAPNRYLNYYYLVQKMVRVDSGMVSESGGTRHIYHNIRAYIKVQRKYISEMAPKELIRTTIIETGSRLLKLLSSIIGKPELIVLIKEPSNVARERQTLFEEALTVAKKT